MSHLHEGAVAYAPHLTIPTACPAAAAILHQAVEDILSIYRDHLARSAESRTRAPAIKRPARLAAVALVANAGRCVSEGFPAFYLSRGRKGLQRSDHPADNRSRDRILAALEEAPDAPLDVTPGSRYRREPTATTVRLRDDLASRLIEALPGSGLQFDPQSPGAVIDRLDLREEGELVEPKPEQAERFAYLRGGVRALNEAIGAGVYSYKGHRRTASPLHRVMTPDLKGRGRWWGGWWQGLSKDDRKTHLEIDGERAVEVDYTACALSIAYGLSGVRMPDGDPYALDGMTDPAARAGIKNFVCAMLAAKKPLRAWPRASFTKNGHRIASDAERHLAGRIKPSELTALITEKHVPIADFFLSSRMDKIQRIESGAIAKAVIGLRKAGVSSLPVHDALWVPASRAELARDAMASALAESLKLPSLEALNLPAPSIDTTTA